MLAGNYHEQIQQPLEEEIRQQCIITPALSENIDHSWYSALKEEFAQPYFRELSENLRGERLQGTVYPHEYQVYSWTHYCKPEDVKVVILGQDPYPDRRAHGLAFSVPKGIEPPMSLRNIYASLKCEIPGFRPPPHGHLRGWAEQGVLLLNVSLTVRTHVPGSHNNIGWKNFIDAVIRKICERNKGVIFLLWGNVAQQNVHLPGELIPRENVFASSHPALHPQSIFHGNFLSCNDRLVQQGMMPINWNHLP